MGDILVWIIIGLAAGGVASLIVPGRTPGGMIGAFVVGVLGAILGGWLVNDVMDMGTGGGIFGSILVAILGAVIILFVLRELGKRT